MRLRRVLCSIAYIDLPGDYAPVPSVCAKCPVCGHETESYGQHSASIRRCLAVMREECPRQCAHYYVADEDEDGWDD